MVGLINLFISILKSPASAISQSDVALMDIATGHFAHMEFITSSELAFPFTREVADLARQTVKRARERSIIDANEASWNDGVWRNAHVEYWNDVSFALPPVFLYGISLAKNVVLCSWMPWLQWILTWKAGTSSRQFQSSIVKW